ncbi:MAG: hypothetical protein V7L27_27040 [Nostoc sp.]|uniref:hypothetical protein n=1 Tax=Nostoc sp. TaxID=1180 RepID=UPI002FF8BD8E
MEPTEEQYLVINALEALNLLVWRLYDEDTGYWHIQTPSTVLPLATILGYKICLQFFELFPLSIGDRGQHGNDCTN